MSRVLVVGEDALTCAIGERLVGELLPGWTMSTPPINTRGITKLVSALPRYMQQAEYVQPVICIADTDGKCPVTLVATWLPQRRVRKFVLRLAVSEAESWLLSDRSGTSGFFKVPLGSVPADPAILPDAKREVLRLARLSKNRPLRSEVISPTDLNKPGAGYNTHLCKFALTTWNPIRAAETSTSLQKAMERIGELKS